MTTTAVRQTRPRLATQGRVARTAWMLLPAVAFLGVFFVYPLWELLLRSLHSAGDPTLDLSALTIANYSSAFADSTFWTMLRATLVLAAGSTVITVIAAYPMAYFLSRAPRQVARILLLAVMIPYFSSILVRLYAFKAVLTPLGLQGTATGALVGMVAYLLPFMIVMLYAAMVAIPANLGPAARTMGASPIRVFTRVLFPLSRPGLVAATLFVFVTSLGFYLTPAVLGDPTKQVVSTYIQQKISQYQWGAASAVGITLLVATLVLFVVSGRALSLSTVVTASSGKGASSTGTFRWTRGNVALGLWSSAVVLFLMLPLVLVVWASFTSESYLQFPPSGYSLRWYREVLSDSGWFNAAWLSVKIGVMTALIATALGLGAAFGIVRGGLPFKGVATTFFYMPLIVPVVLVGGALFGLLVRERLTGTLTGFVIGHVVLTLPVTVIILTNALSSSSRNVELAARTLGANQLQVFVRITVPAVSASIGAAALISFLISWDEAVVSLFLTVDQQSLPVKYLIFVRSQLLPTVAAVGTLLLLASLLAYVALTQGTRLVLRAWRGHLDRREGMSSHV